MYHPLTREEKADLKFKIALQKTLAKHWLKMKWLGIKSIFTTRVTEIVDMGKWSVLDGVLVCPVSWKRHPKFAPIWFGQTYHGYCVEDWGPPILAETPEEAIEIFSRQLKTLNKAVALAEDLLGKLEKANANIDRQFLRG